MAEDEVQLRIQVCSQVQLGNKKTFEEPVILAPGVTLQGAGPQATRIQHFAAADDQHTVLTAGPNTVVKDCMVALPGLFSAVTTLISIPDVAAELDNVTIDGGDNLFSIGVQASGVNSSAGEIRNCLIRRVQFGIQAVQTAINITGNTFDGIRGDAVFIRLPDLKDGEQVLLPMLGRDTWQNTGQNAFRNVLGDFVVSFSEETTMAENNDWGVYEKASIETRMFGPVDFEPYVGQTEKPGQSWDCSAEPSVVSRGFSVADLLLGIVVFGLLTRYSRVISPRDHRR